MHWLNEIEPDNIVQLHVVGYSEVANRYEDLHAESIQEEIWSLTNMVIDYAPVKAIVIERDENFPPENELVRELLLMEASFVKH